MRPLQNEDFWSTVDKSSLRMRLNERKHVKKLYCSLSLTQKKRLLICYCNQIEYLTDCAFTLCLPLLYLGLFPDTENK